MAQLLLNESIETGSRYRGLARIEARAGGRTEFRFELSLRGYLNIEVLRADSGLEKYVIEQNDRIDQLAFDLLGDTRLWWVLADVNRDVITDPHKLPAGQSIEVPSLDFISRLV